MILRAKEERNIIEATDVKVTKTIDYIDTLSFKVPTETIINVDEIIIVKSNAINQMYRVKEIISKDRFRDVFCEHVFFDCKNIVIPVQENGYNNFETYTNIEAVCAHLNRIIRNKGMNDFAFDTKLKRNGVLENDNRTLYDLIFGENGILKVYNCEVVFDNYKVRFVDKLPSNKTEILFHEEKNIHELQETIDFKNIVTKLHVTCKYRPDSSSEKSIEKMRAEFQRREEAIRLREQSQNEERLRKQREAENQYNSSSPKRTKEQIHQQHLENTRRKNAEILQRQQQRATDRLQRFNDKLAKRNQKKEDKEKVIRTIFTSPLVNEYSRVYEASYSFDSTDIETVEELNDWCEANLFTEDDIRDVPIRNFTFKPVEEKYIVNVNDIALVVFSKLKVNKVVNCCKLEYDPMNDNYISIEFGVPNKNPIREQIGRINDRVSNVSNELKKEFSYIDENIEAVIKQELEAYNLLFDERYETEKNNIIQSIEASRLAGEAEASDLNKKIDDSISTERERAIEIQNDFKGRFTRVEQDLRTEAAKLTAAKTEFGERIDQALEEVRFNRGTLEDEINELTRTVDKNRDKSTQEFNQVKNEVTEFGRKQQEISAKFDSNGELLSLKQFKNTYEENARGINRRLEELSNTKIGGRNLLTGTKTFKDFERRQGVWRKEESYQGLDVYSCDTAWCKIEKIYNVEANKTYTFSCWAKRSASGNVALYLHPNENNVLNGNAKHITVGTEWERIFFTFKALKNGTIRATASLTEDRHRLYVCGYKLEHGNVATDWTEAPEDLDNKGFVTTTLLENKVRETASTFNRTLSERISSLSVGGRNYIRYYDEPTRNGLGIFNAAWRHEIINDNTSRSGKLLKLTCIKAGYDAFHIPLCNKLRDSEFQNRQMVWSLDIKCNRDLTINSVGFETNGRRVVNITTNWQRVTHPFINKFTVHFSFTFYNPVGGFRVGDEIYLRDPQLEDGEIATTPRPAEEDRKQDITNLNEWKQTAQSTLNKVSTLENTTNGAITRLGQVETKANAINLSVSSLQRDTVKHSDVVINDSSVQIGSKRVDGRALASILTVQPDAITAITDKMVITANNENLMDILPADFTPTARHTRGSRVYKNEGNFKLSSITELFIKGAVTLRAANSPRHIGLTLTVKYKDNTWGWHRIIINNDAHEFFDNYLFYDTLKLSTTNLNIDNIKEYQFDYFVDDDNYKRNVIFKQMYVYIKRSAELIVDGSITAKQIKAESIETGHIKSGTIESRHVKADAIESKHLKVDEALINKLVANEVLIKKLIATEAFITKVKAIDIDAVKITSGYISGDRIYGGEINGVTLKGHSKIKIGEYGFLQPIDRGLQINAPESYGSNKGVGVQISGVKDGKVPKGMFIYNDPNFSRSDSIGASVDNILLTVKGKISMSTNFNGGLIDGQPILSNFSYSTPVNRVYRISFIGWDGDSGQLYVDDGTGSNGAWWFSPDGNSSDIKLKDNINPADYNALNFIDKLKFYEYDWKKDKYGYQKPHTKVGVIAQELAELDNTLVYAKGDTLAVDDYRLLNITIKAVQELNKKNKKLENELKEIKRRIA